MASSPEELQWIQDMVITPSLKHLSWVYKPTKGQWEPSQQVEVLGLLFNLQ